MKIDEIKFGSITVDGKLYHDIIISNDEVRNRDDDKLAELFGTDHQIGDWEASALLAGSPKYIIIGTGFYGVLQVQPEVLQKLKNSAAEILVLHSPTAANKYNELIGQGRKVNALIHTTC